MMGNYINAHCRICGKGYHRCNCNSEGNWRKVTDIAEHYQIFCVIRDYNNEIIDANKANELLQKLDLSEKDSFNENVKEVLADITSKKTIVEVKKADTVNTTKAAEPMVGNNNGQKQAQQKAGKPNQHSKNQQTWKK